MAGEAQMPDAAVLLLFHQILENTIFRIQILFNIHLAHIVKQIKIKVIHPAAFQLLFKNFLHFSHIAQIISGKFGCKIEVLSRIRRQHLAHHPL